MERRETVLRPDALVTFVDFGFAIVPVMRTLAAIPRMRGSERYNPKPVPGAVAAGFSP